MKVKTGVSLFLILSAFLITAGCGIVKTNKVTRGHNIASGDVNAIVKGQTTEHEILKLFGPPTKMRDTDEGQEYMYEYAQSGGPRWDLVVNVGGSTHTKTLIVWFDKNHVVTDYAYKVS